MLALNQKINLTCPKCSKENEVLFLKGFSQTTREKGTTGISHLVTRTKATKIIGECNCGYSFKPKDLEEC